MSGAKRSRKICSCSFSVQPSKTVSQQKRDPISHPPPPPCTLLQIAQQRIHPLQIRIPRKHHPCRAANKLIELPSPPAQCSPESLPKPQKHRIRIHCRNHPHIRNPCHPFREVLRTLVGMPGVAQPCSALQHPHPRSGKKPHLRSQLPRLLAAIIEIRCQPFVEEQHRFTHCHAILRPSKTQHIDATLPAQLRRRTPQARARIRKARSIHVQRRAHALCTPPKSLSLHPACTPAPSRSVA